MDKVSISDNRENDNNSIDNNTTNKVSRYKGSNSSNSNKNRLEVSNNLEHCRSYQTGTTKLTYNSRFNSNNIEMYSAKATQKQRLSGFSNDGKMKKYTTQKTKNVKEENINLSESMNMKKYETQVTRKSQKKNSERAEKTEKMIESNYFDLGESNIMNVFNQKYTPGGGKV